ncbi:hypothetical protein J437_LFUL013910 [Ladona fulva]|nr:hypothetical protein J437_LFUL013910 [Ladona fulva]
MLLSGDHIAAVDADPTLLDRLITGDITWCYLNDPQSKRQSMVWKSLSSPWPKKFRADGSRGKVMLVVFFNCKEIVHYELVPEGCTVNKELHVTIFKWLRKAVCWKRPDLWQQKFWVLHHDNAPIHRSLLVTQFLDKHDILTLPQPPYSTDLIPCEFFLFHRFKSHLKGRRYTDSEAEQTAATRTLTEVAKTGL